ncbi:hypothetical protein C8Q75DRAFT_295338 [Abortiporus biennis]|nr:hypothetical protein C8Q75DRAFT_295338 [Abortiporus biennis]
MSEQSLFIGTTLVRQGDHTISPLPFSLLERVRPSKPVMVKNLLRLKAYFTRGRTVEVGKRLSHFNCVPLLDECGVPWSTLTDDLRKIHHAGKSGPLKSGPGPSYQHIHPMSFHSTLFDTYMADANFTPRSRPADVQRGLSSQTIGTIGTFLPPSPQIIPVNTIAPYSHFPFNSCAKCSHEPSLCPDTTVTIPGDSVDARLAVISDRRYESVDHVLHSRKEG